MDQDPAGADTVAIGSGFAGEGRVDQHPAEQRQQQERPTTRDQQRERAGSKKAAERFNR